MKLVTYNSSSSGSSTSGKVGLRSGLLVGDALDTIVDLASALDHLGGKKNVDGRTVLGLVEAGKEGLSAARDVLTAFREKKLPDAVIVKASTVKLAAPIPRPPSMRDG